jgi:hypothetical protein
MKQRSGFVSNSSSSSFTIAKDKLTLEQYEKIVNHFELGAQMGLYTGDDWNRWRIRVTPVIGEIVEGYTDMDNFDMREFLEKIGVDMDAVEWWHS